MTDARLASLTARCADLWNEQQFEEVERGARSALAHYPADKNLRMFLAYSLLGQGNYRDGFREHEGRSHRRFSPLLNLNYPEWDGPIAGRSILVCGEQGIGDEIQTVRFIPRLRELGAARITLVCWPQNVRAFQNVGADLVIGREGKTAIPQHDCWAVSWSLPYRMGLELGDISGAPYLAADPLQLGGIGLVEQGRPENPRDRNRSMPARILQAAVPEGRLLTAAGDVHDSLRLVAGLDLLITVDTSWAHMAGALGVPCWVLLPRHDLDWRWLRDRSDTPWYDSIRLFRQERADDWSGVLAQVREALAATSASDGEHAARSEGVDGVAARRGDRPACRTLWS